MRNRLTKLLVFIFVLVVVDHAAGYMLRKLFFNQKASQESSLTYSFFHCKADLLIFGNSRAQRHYDTRVIADSLKISCFNAGISGYGMLLPCVQIEVILKRYSPKIIVFEIDPADFEYSAGEYDRLSVLLPYYHALSQLRPLILRRSPFEGFKLLSGIYPFNSNVINIIRYNFNFANPFAHRARRKDFDGYVPIVNKEMQGTIPNTSSEKAHAAIIDTAVIDTNLLKALERIIRLCQKKNIHLILVNSPVFHNRGDHSVPLSKAAKQVLALIHLEKAEFLDFTLEPLFVGQMELFADRDHLNEKGAAIFTRLFIQKTNLGDKLGKKEESSQ